MAWVSQFHRDVATVREQSEGALALAIGQAFPLWIAKATITRGWAVVMQDKSEEGVLELQKGVAAWRAAGAGAMLSHYCSMQAEALGLLRKPEEVLQVLDDAKAAMERAEEHWWEAEIYRLRGTLLLQLSMSRQGEAET